MIYVGIDTGLTGAIAFHNSTAVQVYDTPTFWQTKSNGKRKRIYDPFLISRLYLPSKKVKVVVGLELAHARPGEGVVSSFSFGVGFGIHQGVVGAYGHQLAIISPQKWKREFFGKGKSTKDDSRYKAIELFPYLEDKLIRKGDHNRAEAILISEYLKREFERGNADKLKYLPPIVAKK